MKQQLSNVSTDKNKMAEVEEIIAQYDSKVSMFN